MHKTEQMYDFPGWKVQCLGKGDEALSFGSLRSRDRMRSMK